MLKYVTRISKEDFIKLYPDVLPVGYIKEENDKLFPLAVSIHNDYPNGGYYGKYLGWNCQFVADQVKHIYSTRDYFEVERTEEPGFKYKIPKKETKAIYLVERY